MSPQRIIPPTPLNPEPTAADNLTFRNRLETDGLIPPIEPQSGWLQQEGSMAVNAVNSTRQRERPLAVHRIDAPGSNSGRYRTKPAVAASAGRQSATVDLVSPRPGLQPRGPGRRGLLSGLLPILSALGAVQAPATAAPSLP